jgi:ESCRT-I complex subunit VPS37
LRPANNLKLQEQLYKLRADTQDAFNEAKALEARWKELEKEQKEVYQVHSFVLTPLHHLTRPTMQRFNPQFLLMRLRHSTTAQDDASEALASAFIQQSAPTPSHGIGDTGSQPESGTGTPSGKEIDEFVRAFKESRKVYHKRVMWGDRWASGQVQWRED